MKGGPLQSKDARRGRRFAKRWLEAGLDLVFPPHCAGCGRAGEVWCASCHARLRKPAGRGCPACGFPRIHSRRCLACELGEGRLSLRSYACYGPPLTQAILRLKYRPDRKLAGIFAAWLHEILGPNRSGLEEIIIPIPLASARMKQRGYNQVELIAAALASMRGQPHRPRALRRIRDTGSQVGLDPGARRRNVAGAFQADEPSVESKVVLLLDDIVTTGATLLSASEALLEAGAVRVFCLTVGFAAG
ncbi:MAG TPA: ComF family protein [Chloroflexi bacterium]|nr:ComF family protein [Chloroflexota bacterium]